MRLRAASAVLVATALVGGCSSSGAPAKPASIALSDVVLQDSDLPAGWSSGPHVAKGDEDTQQTKLLHCLDARDTRPHIIGSVQSPDFVSDQGRVASVIRRFRSQADIDTDVKTLRKSGQKTCREKVLHSSLHKALPDGTSISKIDLTLDTSPKGLPKDVKAVEHAFIEFSTDVKPSFKDKKPKPKISKAYLDIAYVFGRATETTLTFTSADDPLDPDLETRLITKVADRVAKI